MSKIKTFTLLGLLCIAFVKSLLLAPTYADVAVIAVIGSIYAYLEYKSKDKELEKLTLAVNQHESDIKELKDKMSALNFRQQIKPTPINLR